MNGKLTAEECRWIDDACDNFEAARRWGPIAIRERLSVSRCAPGVEAELLKNLVMIDVDHRLKELATQGASNVLLLASYVDEFPELAADARRFEDLVRYEFSSAMEFQLAPRIARYLQAFPNYTNLEQVLRAVAVEVDCRWLHVHTQAIEYKTHLGFDAIEFGRQSKHEALLRSRNDIATLADASSSFPPMTVVSQDAICGWNGQGQHRIIVRNISRKSEVLVRSTRLLPGQCLESRADGEIRIGDTRIRIVPHDG